MEERKSLEEKLKISEGNLEELQASSVIEKNSLHSKLEAQAEEFEKFSNENKSLSTDINNLKTRIKDLDQNLEEKDLLIDGLKESIKSQGEVNSIEKDSEINDEIEKKREEIKRLTDAMKEKEESFHTDIEQLKNQISSVEAEKMEANASLEKVKTEKEALNRDFEMFRNSNANFKEQMASVQEACY